jgi:hypothetical protein
VWDAALTAATPAARRAALTKFKSARDTLDARINAVVFYHDLKGEDPDGTRVRSERVGNEDIPRLPNALRTTFSDAFQVDPRHDNEANAALTAATPAARRAALTKFISRVKTLMGPGSGPKGSGMRIFPGFLMR